MLLVVESSKKLPKDFFTFHRFINYDVRQTIQEYSKRRAMSDFWSTMPMAGACYCIWLWLQLLFYNIKDSYYHYFDDISITIHISIAWLEQDGHGMGRRMGRR